LLVLALARPQGELEPAVVSLSGRAWMLVVDLSASMDTRDLSIGSEEISRADAARRLATEFLAARPGDRAALIVFGQQAYLHTPLTHDLRSVSAALTALPPGLAGRETALGDAIGLALRHIGGGDSRLVPGIILLTDGAGNAGTLSPERAAWIARREQVRVHVLGLGSLAEDDPASTTLATIAKDTGGAFARATNVAELAAFTESIDALTPGSPPNAPGRVEFYVWPAGAALLLTLAMLLWRNRNRGRGQHEPA
jgi:Ca-activated chloride channel family protein